MQTITPIPMKKFYTLANIIFVFKKRFCTLFFSKFVFQFKEKK